MRIFWIGLIAVILVYGGLAIATVLTDEPEAWCDAGDCGFSCAEAEEAVAAYEGRASQEKSVPRDRYEVARITLDNDCETPSPEEESP
ncbi:MAG TPA: hypothetical protein VIW01_01765 [Dehalococcoidia bacterium]